MGKTNFSLNTLFFNLWVILATWLHVGAPPSKNTGKINLKPILNKTSPWACIELGFDVLGVPKKLVKYVVHLSKRKN
jgi:hypothetical protein